MVRWCNDNSGFVIAVLTLVYVVCTVILSNSAKRANALAADNLSQALELERRRTRPRIIFNLENRERFIHAVLRNFGLDPAFDVSVTIRPRLEHVAGNLKGKESSLTNANLNPSKIRSF
ncbi:MAG: hypothetical protein V2A71_01255 [Candidatus Eisenbacteria bacterium]